MRKPAKRHKTITLREAAAMVMNPDNPQASYPELDRSVERTAQVFRVASLISRLAGAAAVVIAAGYALYASATHSTPVPVLAATLIALGVLAFAVFHPLTLRKTFVGAWLLPPEPEPVRDLFDRLARGEFAAKWSEGANPTVSLADVKTVIADRKADAASPRSRRPAKPPGRTKIRNLQMDLKLQAPLPDADFVEPASLEELNACRGHSLVKINTAYSFILGGGDPQEGAALLRRLERESNSIIRQPDSQYVKVGDLRGFLKKQGYAGVGGSPWDGS